MKLLFANYKESSKKNSNKSMVISKSDKKMIMLFKSYDRYLKKREEKAWLIRVKFNKSKRF